MYVCIYVYIYAPIHVHVCTMYVPIMYPYMLSEGENSKAGAEAFRKGRGKREKRRREPMPEVKPITTPLAFIAKPNSRGRREGMTEVGGGGCPLASWLGQDGPSVYLFV